MPLSLSRDSSSREAGRLRNENEGQALAGCLGLQRNLHIFNNTASLDPDAVLSTILSVDTERDGVESGYNAKQRNL